MDNSSTDYYEILGVEPTASFVILICDNYDLAINIQNILLDKKMIAGCQMMEINSKYFWNKELFNKTEYRIDMKTIDS